MTSDPHGLILSLISVCTVFLCLLVLYGVYSLVGAFFTRKGSTKEEASLPVPAEQEDDSQIAAAIAVALDLYKKDNQRRITIDSKETQWGSPERNFRRYERL